MSTLLVSFFNFFLDFYFSSLYTKNIKKKLKKGGSNE
nr:MAG TPA: hypothetical protein [Caudoviricetes sp.]